MKAKLKKIWEDHFYPHKKFKDCQNSSQLERRNNYYYNQENKNFMVSPILTWCLISVYILLSISFIEAIINKEFFPTFNLAKYEAILNMSMISLGVLFTLSFVVSCVFIATYLYFCFINED